MATLTGHLVADTYKALLKLIDNDILTASEKQISDGFGGGSNVFIDQNGFLRAAQYKVTGGTSSQFLKGNGSLDSNTYLTAAVANTLYLPIGSTTTAIAEGTRLYFLTARVLATTLAGFVATSGTVTAADTILSSIEKIWYNIINGGGGGGGGYVPYIGATQDLDLGTFGLIGDFVQFNTTNSAIPVGAGTMAFNNIDGTADIRLKGGNVNLPIGQQEVVRVVNVTGASLLGADYQAVYISGAVGQILQVDLALAVTGVTSAGTLGLVSETIADTLEGFITSSGLVREIDTTGDLQGEIWADGDILYLSPTVAGQITNVQPIAPDLTVIIGFVVYADAIDGKIFVKVNGGISGAGDINYVPKFDSVNSITNSLIYDDGIDIGIATISPTFPADRSGLVIRANGVNSSEILLQSSINTDATIQGLAIANIFNEGGAIYQRANQHLRFGTNNLERMRLTEGGYLAIGLTAPSSIIHAKDSTAYGKIIIDNNGLTGGGSFSASQNGTETAIFGVSGSWATNTTSDAAVVATRASQGIKFYTNGSTTAKGGIDSVGDSFIGQLPAYYAGVTNFIVQGIAAGSLIGITHFDGTIKGIFSTLNSGVNIGSDTPHPVIFRADDIESARIASDGKWLFGTNVNDNVNIVQVNGSIIATSLKKSGGIATEFLKADGSVDSNTYYLASNPSNFITLTAISTTASGLTYNNTTGVISLTVGYVIPLSSSATNWDTAYNSRIASLTTTGDSGNATFISNVLNIPTITLSGIGGQPVATNLTSLSTLNYVSTSFVKMTGSGAFSLDTNTYYLASNPSSFIPLTALSSTALGLTYTNTTGVFSLTAGYMIPTSVQAAQWNTAYTNTISSATGPLSIASNVISIALATASISGYLSASDFNTFNNKENLLIFSSPLIRTVNTITISQASGSTNGYLSSTDWTTFNNKSNTNGTVTSVSGAGTVSGLTLTGNVTTTGSLTLGGTLSLTSLNVTTALGFTPVTNARTLTINGTTYDLTADRSWTVSGTISGLTSGYITKATSALTIGNSLIYDNGTNVGIGTTSPTSILTLYHSNYTFLECKTPSVVFGLGANHPTQLAYLGTSSNHSLVVQTNSTERMRLFSGGNIGINTTTDAGYKLDVNGTARVSGAATFSSTLTANSISLTGAANIQNTTTGGYLALFGNTGGVYLGAHNGVGYQNYLVINASTGAVTLTGALSGTSASFSSSLIANTYVEIVGDLRFNSSAAERKIYFRGSGIGPDTNWSMGTYVTPTGATVVTAAATVIDVYGGATGYGFMVRNTSNVPLLQIAGNTGAATFSSSVTATSHNGTTQNIFSVDGTERMRLFSTGNLALNTTTDSGYKLDVNGTARVSGNLTAVTGTWDTFGIAVNNIRRNLETTLTINSSGVAANSLQFTSTTGWSSITSGTVNGMINSMSLNGSGTVSFANFAFTGIHSSTSSGSLTIININNSITTTNASSIVRGLYYNPSLISVAGSHRAFENTTGNVLLGTTSGSVGIGVNTSINASAILDITSTTKGVLFPRMTTTQKNAIATPATGLVVYDTTTNAQNYYDGTAWVALALTSSLSGYVPTSRSLTINGTAFDLSADRTWSVGTVTGSGTTNFISKFTGSTALGNSLIYDNGTSVGIGTTSATAKLEVISSSDGLFVTTSNSSQTLRLSSATNNNTLFRINNFNNNFYDIQNQPSDNSLVIDYNDTERLRITSEGGVNINSSTTGYTLNAIRSASTQFNDEFRGTGGLIQIFARFMQDESTKKGIAIGYNTTYSYSGIFGTQDTSSLRLGILVGSSFKAKIAMNTTTVSMDLPTSASGLNAGDLYNDSGTVKIV